MTHARRAVDATPTVPRGAWHPNRSPPLEAGIEPETAAGHVVHGRREPFTDKLCTA